MFSGACQQALIAKLVARGLISAALLATPLVVSVNHAWALSEIKREEIPPPGQTPDAKTTTPPAETQPGTEVPMPDPISPAAPDAGETTEPQPENPDLPGVNPHEAGALQQLQQRLASLPGAQVHLVLNAAYETPLLLAQIRAFAAVPIQDVIVTHLDEESRWGKLWNLTLGTNCTLRFLAAGQNIPGEFIPATPDEIFRRQFPRKTGAIAAQR